MTERLERHVTPPGTARWPKLWEADKFNKIGLNFVLDAETAAAVSEAIDAAYDAHKEDMKVQMAKKKKPFSSLEWNAKPYRNDVDPDTGEENGDVVFRFLQDKTREKDGKILEFSIAVFDAKGTPIKAGAIKVGSGTTCRVAFTIFPYVAGNKCGVSMRPQAVQILNLVEWNGRDAESFGFSEEASGFAINETDSKECAEETMETPVAVGDVSGGDF